MVFPEFPVPSGGSFRWSLQEYHDLLLLSSRWYRRYRILSSSDTGCISAFSQRYTAYRRYWNGTRRTCAGWNVYCTVEKKIIKNMGIPHYGLPIFPVFNITGRMCWLIQWLLPRHALLRWSWSGVLKELSVHCCDVLSAYTQQYAVFPNICHIYFKGCCNLKYLRFIFHAAMQHFCKKNLFHMDCIICRKPGWCTGEGFRTFFRQIL